MPLYEYKCGSCGNVFEVIQKFSDQPLTVHEICGGPLERLISTSALQFKGSGWYVNDYGKGNSKGKCNDKIRSSSRRLGIIPVIEISFRIAASRLITVLNRLRR